MHVIDFDHPDNNDWVAVNQFTVVEGQNNTATGRSRLHQRSAHRADGVEEPGDENATIWTAFQPDSDLQSADSVAVHVQRTAHHLRWDGGAGWLADGRHGAVHAVAHDRGRGTRSAVIAAASGGDRGSAGQAPAAGLHPLLRRLRGRGRRSSGQEDRRLPPVPRREPRR